MWKALSILAALLAGGAAYLSYENKQDSIQENVLKTRSDKNLETTNAWLQEADTALKTVSTKLQDTTDKSETTADQLKKTQEEEMKAQEDLKAIKETITEKETKLAGLQDQIKEIGDIEEAAAQLDALTAAIEQYESSLAAKKQEAQSKAAVASSTNEKIEEFKNLEVWQKNGKMESLSASVSDFIPEYNLVVINAGNNRGVVSRAKLDVRRGSDKIGEILVDVLQPNRSVCKIASIAPGMTIQAGDRVVVNDESKPGVEDSAAAADAAAALGAAAPVNAGGGAADMPAPVEPKPDALDDPFGIDSVEPGEGAAEAPADGGAEMEDDPFGLN